MTQDGETVDGTPNAAIVIPKHLAAFRMDGNGRWHNRDGPFRHQRVIDHFNAAIEMDASGYFILQQREGVTEKVYFPHEGTALFVVEVLWGNPTRLELNTGENMVMEPRHLFVYEDHLYCRIGDENAKFNQHALTNLSERLSCVDGSYYLSTGSRRIRIIESPLNQ